MKWLLYPTLLGIALLVHCVQQKSHEVAVTQLEKFVRDLDGEKKVPKEYGLLEVVKRRYGEVSKDVCVENKLEALISFSFHE